MLSFPASEFDEWAESYDSSVGQERGFPFEGYGGMLQKIVSMADPHPGASVLDLGTGTGNLAGMFAQQGCKVWGIDFSNEMIRIARQKFETIHFSAHDLRDPLPEGLPTDFDRIVSAYTFHHFTLEKKIDIIQGVFQHLNANGFLVIGDICFKNEAIRRAVKSRYVEDWEDEEYWCAEMDTSVLQKAGFSAQVILQSDYLALLVIRKQ